MTVVQVGKNVSNSTSFKRQDVFEIRKLKNLYIQGNLGMEKSSYSLKMALDWCNHIVRQRFYHSRKLTCFSKLNCCKPTDAPLNVQDMYEGKDNSL